MDGIIKGKHAKNYDNKLFSKKNLYKPNCFLNREIPKNKILVDLCCGSGVSIMFLKDRCKKIYGIDASEDMIKICKNRFKNDKNVNLIYSNASQTTLKNNYCDIILIRNGLHHIKDKKSVIFECSRILKPKGKLYIMDKFLFYNKFTTNILDFLKNLKKGYSLWGHHFCSLKDFENMTKNSFTVTYQTKIKKGFNIKSNMILEKI